jgi:hypothetical protein
MDTKVLKCKTCKTEFNSVKSFKDHFNSDWHRYNYKRTIISLGPVSEQVFIDKRQAMMDKERKIKENLESKRNIECKDCKKKFKSESTLAHHLQSKKHGKVVYNLKRKNAFKKNKKSEQFEIEKTIKEKNEILDCLFCKEFSLTWQENIKHMRDSHGFIIPEKRSCLSFTNLIKSIHANINNKKQCLVCEMSFETPEATKSHMKDKSHCRLIDSDILNDLSLYNHLGMNVLKLKKIINRFGESISSKLTIENEELKKLILDGHLETMVNQNQIQEGISLLDMENSSSKFSVVGDSNASNNKTNTNILDELIDLDSIDDNFEIVSDSLSYISNKNENELSISESLKSSKQSNTMKCTEEGLEGNEISKSKSVSESSGLQSYTQLNTTKYSNHPFMLTDLINQYCAQNLEKIEQDDSVYQITFLSCKMDIRLMIDFPSLILNKFAKINKNGELVLGDKIYGNRKFRHIYKQKISSIRLKEMEQNALMSSQLNSETSSDYGVRSFQSEESSNENTQKKKKNKIFESKTQLRKEYKRQKQMQKAQMKLLKKNGKKVKIKKKL